MPSTAGQIVIDISAGTSKFVVDLEAAKGKIREFGAAGVGEHKAVSAAMKTLEGNFTNNKRAADAFITTVLGAGPILKAAFPVVGALAFVGVIGEIGGKVDDFFKQMREGPEKIGGAFRSLNEPLRLTNDELLVANDRLANDIAKLEGKRQNTLKVALDEARVAADRLADSLDKDLSALDKVLRDAEPGRVGHWFQWFIGNGSTNLAKELGGETGFGGFTGRVDKITSEGRANMDRAAMAKNLDAEEDARRQMNKRLLAEYQAELFSVQAHVAEASPDPKRANDPYYRPPTPPAGYLERLEHLQSTLQEQIAFTSLQSASTALSAKKTGLETGAENAQLDKPFDDRMKALDAQLDGVKAKLAAIGQPEAAQVIAKAFSEAQKAIEEVNKALERHHTQLSADQKTQIAAVEQSITSAEAEATWKTHLESSTTSINDRIRSQELLTAAIGKGYEATKRANVETQLMRDLGAHYNDAAWMGSHQAEVQGLRSGIGREYDAQYGDSVAGAIEKLRQQIGLEKELAAVQAQGAEAVRQAALAHKLQQMALEGATRAQLQAEIELYNATRANADAESTAKINERIAATERLTAAVFAGAEAQRKAALENKYAEMARAGATPEQIGAERGLDEAEHQRTIAEEAGKTVTVYQDQLEHLNQIEAALEKQKADHGDTLEIEIALRDVENERLKIAVQQELKLRGAKDGLKAFFLEMQEDAKSAANIVYDSLNSALDKVSDQFAKLFTRQKTSFGKMFEGIGEEMVKESTKSMMQKGLGELGKLFGVKPPTGKPDGTQGNPYHVVIAGQGPSGTEPVDDSGTPVSHSALGGLGGLLKSGAGALGSLVKGLFGGGGGGGGESVDSSITYMAEGGDVDPGRGYVVGDGGEPEYFQPKTAGTITPAHKMGGSFSYHIDARGADLGAANRTARAIEAAHNAAVANAVRANAERNKRTPQRTGR